MSYSPIAVVSSESLSNLVGHGGRPGDRMDHFRYVESHGYHNLQL